MAAAGVIGFLEVLMLKRGQPQNVRSDNGPEFVAQALKGWRERAFRRVHRAGKSLGEWACGKLPRETARRLLEPGSVWKFAGSQSTVGRMAPAI